MCLFRSYHLLSTTLVKFGSLSKPSRRESPGITAPLLIARFEGWVRRFGSGDGERELDGDFDGSVTVDE